MDHAGPVHCAQASSGVLRVNTVQIGAICITSENPSPMKNHRSPTKYTYLLCFSNLLANLSVPKRRPSGRIPGIARARVIENPSSILVSPPFTNYLQLAAVRH